MSLTLFDYAEARPAIAPLSAADARTLTDEVKRDAHALWQKLLTLYDGGAHTALGYSSWGAYFEAEFGGHQSRGYQLLDSARVLGAIAHSTTVEPPTNEAQARELAPLLRAEPGAIPEVWKEAQAAAAEADRSVTAADVREAVIRRETKSHADAHAERLAAYEAQAEAPPPVLTTPDVPAVYVLPYDRIVQQDALSYLRSLPDGSADLCFTSPAYWAKRTYTDGHPDELGQEREPAEYVDRLCEIVNEIGRVLKPGACLFLNLGDTLASQPGQYRGDPERRRGISNQAIKANGTAPAERVFDTDAEKTFCLVPETVALRLVLDYGWRMADKIVWHKLGYAPENVYDRLTQAWEPVYVLTRSRHAYFRREPDGVAERPNDVWAVPVGRRGAAAGHLAPFPEELVRRAIRHACRPGGVVLDPFAGSGTTKRVANGEGCRFLGCDLMAESE